MPIWYDLHKLGWKSFQQLCHTILRENLGQTVELFNDTHDAGRDGAFSGTWTALGDENLAGPCVIQCKHVSQPHRNLNPSDLTAEFPKVRRLVERGICDAYVLMTNASLTARSDEEIKARLRTVGVKHARSFDANWINAQISESSHLRGLVPRVYGLGDLSQILDGRRYRQAQAILDWMREDLSKVVLTSASLKAEEAIRNHSFVLLTGEPAAGKTTIAALLALAAVDRWNALPLKLEDPADVANHWNPDEPNQLFWIDDAFGATQYEHSRIQDWNRVLPRFQAMTTRGAKIVMTSRDYIYRRARRDLKTGAFPLVRESNVVVDVRDLKLEEKRQILYNHLKLGQQPRAFLTKVKPHLEAVAGHDRFTPETARRLATPIFTEHLHPSHGSLMKFVDRQESFLQETVTGLDPHSRAALSLIYLRGGRVGSPIHLQESETAALERLGSDLGSCLDALEALRGSLVLYADTGSEPIWQFKHPTIGDAFASLVAGSPEHLLIFLQGAEPVKLLNQVTCGRVGIENAIVLGEPHFSVMLNKLDQLLKTAPRAKGSWPARRPTWAVKQFLSYRCSREFLSLYLQEHPAFLDQVTKPGLFLEARAEVRLVPRLHELRLLPETYRCRFVETVSRYAVEGHDYSPYLISVSVRSSRRRSSRRC